LGKKKPNPNVAVLPPGEIVRILVVAAPRRERFACPAAVRVGPHRGHAITIVEVAGGSVLFHDPWPESSLLAADRNELGIDAQRDGERWRISTDELGRCVQALFMSPEILAEMQGKAYRRSLTEVLNALGFFNIREVRLIQRDDVWDVEVRPGGFQEHVRIRFAVDGADRLEAALLGLERSWLQVDVKFIEPLGQTGRKQKYYQFTAIDDCTRLRVLRAYPRCDQKTAIAFIDHSLAKLPFAVERVQTDNGSERHLVPLAHLLDKGIDHVKIKPRTPPLNGKVERSQRIDSEEFYRLLQVIHDTRLFTDKLQEWEDYYNYHRPHGALGGQTPYERLRQKTQDPLS
jgi:transposase InsO family protein